MWPLSKCTRCYVTTCLLWTPVGVRVVDDEIPGGGRGRGVTAFAGCVPWWMGMMVSGTNRSAKCLLVIAAIFRNVHRAQILDALSLFLFLNFDSKIRMKSSLLNDDDESHFFLRSRKKRIPFIFFLVIEKKPKIPSSLFRIEGRKNCASRKRKEEKKKNLKLLKCHLPSQLRCLASISGRATSCSSCAREKKTSICVRDECGLRSRSAYHQRNLPPSPLDIYFTCRWCTRQRTKPRGNHRIDPVTPYPRERVTLQSVPGAPLEGR